MLRLSKPYRKIYLSFWGVGVLSSLALAVPPAPGQAWPGGKACFVNSKAAANRLSPALGAAGFASLPPSYNIFVIRVQFPDRALTTNTASAFFQKVQEYYKENSFNNFSPIFTIGPVFTLPNVEAVYGGNCGGDVACHVPRLIQDSVSAAIPSIDFRQYDQIMIYHAGYGEESRGPTSDIWSLFFPSTDMAHYGYGPISADGKPFDGATIVPELEHGASALGVICHEYGHQLGLPDLYNTAASGGISVVGAWDLMDYPWMGNPQGSNPPHLGAWSKRFLGFGTQDVLTSSGTIALTPMELSPGRSVEIPIGSEYFLVEYRTTTAAQFDASLPQSAGLAVWHVDPALAENQTILDQNTVNNPSQNGKGHYGVDLIEADGRAVYPPGGADLWSNGQTLSAPASNLFSVAVSSLVMTGIRGVGSPTVTAQIFYRPTQSSQSIMSAMSFPNPARGKVRAEAPPGTLATFRIQLARPPSALKATLYTILGQRVIEVPYSSFKDTGDLDWRYDCDWNGKDENGADVASGVYYLQFEVDGEKIRKPIVVQR